MTVNNIAIVFNSLHIGGIERKIVDISNHYSKQKNTHLILILKLNQGFFLNQIPPNVEILTMSKTTHFLTNIMFTSWVWLQLYRFRPTLTITFGNFASICTIIASRFLIHTKIVISEDSSIDEQINSDSFPLIRKTLVRLTYPLANGIIALTPIAKQKLSILAPAQKIKILPNWLPICIPPSFPSSSRPIDILFVGRFEMQKNPLKFLELCQKIQTINPSTKIVMVGHGSLLPQINSFIKKNHLKIGLLPANTPIQNLYPRAKCLVLTSVHEGFPLTILESFYYFCPVICPALKELTPFFKYEPKKYLYNSPEEAIKLISHAISNPQSLQKVTQKYRDSVIASRDKNFHDTLDYLQQFI